MKVDQKFKPSINFYCLTDESNGNFKAIKKILTIGMSENNNTTTSKKFAGTIYSNLEDPKVLYFNVNGDFYKKGTPKIETIKNITSPESITVSFDLLDPNKSYKYSCKEGRLHL